jgi:hypothetical protein
MPKESCTEFFHRRVSHVIAPKEKRKGLVCIIVDGKSGHSVSCCDSIRTFFGEAGFQQISATRSMSHH